jgi:hypothetical protein
LQHSFGATLAGAPGGMAKAETTWLAAQHFMLPSLHVVTTLSPQVSWSPAAQQA